ncbi:septal ring lytic transglycosylase RlpA family protein [Orrella sp. JC864]|uniref:septal ring lytic transglycosylase RlpA family protein n=1 Tax=Orrella sp. JC864 TaxID=3120298 RepID=UPI0012BCE0B4
MLDRVAPAWFLPLPAWLCRLAVLALILLLAACGSAPKTGTRGGGYYKDDGPPARPPSNLDRVPDAVPRIEPLASGPNRPYVIFGKRYVPDTSGQPYRARGVASWYGKKFHGNPTSNGERYDMYAMTAAHPTLPIPSYVRVTRVATGKTVVLRVNDRGPFHSNRIIDLSYVAAHKLGILGPGSDEVIVERIMPDEIRRIAAGAPAVPPQQAPAAQPVALREPAQAPAPLPPPAAPRPLPPPPAPASFAAAPVAGAYFLQLGAFGEPGNAQALAGRVNSAFQPGETPAVTVQQVDRWYRVRIGPYPDRAAAESALQMVADRTGVQPALAFGH